VVGGRRRGRKWRLRGRRGQVSAVATILGLLLVVTYIANYLTTTLPQQMSINDLNHDVQVQDQVGRLQALLEAASASAATAAQFTQPITLGSSGQPPFAVADPATIGPATNGSIFSLSLPIAGPAFTYGPPTGGVAGGIVAPCALINTGVVGSITCSATEVAQVTYNFSSTPTSGFSFTADDGGTMFLNVTTSGASTAALEPITLTLNGVAPVNLIVIGNNDTVSVTISTGSTVNLVIIGNDDKLTLTNAAVTSTVTLVEVGYLDTNTITAAPDLLFFASIYGASDPVTVGATTAESTASTDIGVFYTGWSPGTVACPNDNEATQTTDAVTGGDHGTYTANWNVSATFTPAHVNHWTLTATVVSPQRPVYCPFYVQKATPMTLGETGGGFSVHLVNSYLPQADVAFDEGGVVFAQSGGVPVMIDPPGFDATLTAGALTSLTIWFPQFIGTLPVDSGLSTAEISARLVSLNTLVVTPTSQTLIASNSIINVTVVSPFAAAWEGYFNSTNPYSGYNSGCYGPVAACDGPYATGGPLGTAFLDIPSGTQLQNVEIQIATFSLSLV
jgi:hypothetical protein